MIEKFCKRYPAQTLELKSPDALVLIPPDSSRINILENAVQHAGGRIKLGLRVFLMDNHTAL